MNATAYRDMIHLSRPISRHPKMSVENRAKLFTPFSALRGFDIEILTKEQDRLLVSQVTLDAERSPVWAVGHGHLFQVRKRAGRHSPGGVRHPNREGQAGGRFLPGVGAGQWCGGL